MKPTTRDRALYLGLFLQVMACVVLGASSFRTMEPNWTAAAVLSLLMADSVRTVPAARGSRK